MSEITLPSGVINHEVPIDALRPHPRNFRRHPERQIENLVASFRRFGQFRSIVAVEETAGHYLIIAGHGITEAMRKAGARTVRIDELPKETDAATLEAIMIADNLHADHAVDNDDLLLLLLQEQADAGIDLASLGSSAQQLDELQLLLEQTTPKAVSSTGSLTPAPKPASVSVFLAVSSLAQIEAALALTEADTRGEALQTICAFYLEAHEAG